MKRTINIGGWSAHIYNPRTKHPSDMKATDLFKWMLGQQRVTLACGLIVKEGIIRAIEMEDGSGKCFNVRFDTGETMFIRFNDVQKE